MNSGVIDSGRVARPARPWPMVRLGDVCEEIRERVPSSKITSANYVTTDNMIKGCGGVRFENNVPLDVGLVSYRPGDVLVSNIRPYLRKSWLSDRMGGCSSDVIVFRAIKKDLSASYLYAALSSDAFFDYSMQNVSGTKMPRGKRDWIKKFTFPLPPLSVQREIVGRLEKELGKADELAAKSKRLGALADELFKSELDAAFKNVKGEKVRLGDVGRIITGSTPSKSCKAFYGNEYPLFKPSDLNQGYDVVSACDGLTELGWKAARQLPKNSVLVTCIGATLGKAGIIRAAGSCNQQINAIICENSLPEFAYYFVISPSFQSELWHDSHATTLPIVPKSKFEKFEIPLPPLATQREIVARLDAARERSEKLKAAAERGAALAAELRKSILQEAFA